MEINSDMEINSNSLILMANDTKYCAFCENFRSGHYNMVGTSLYQMTVPNRATIEEQRPTCDGFLTNEKSLVHL